MPSPTAIKFRAAIWYTAGGLIIMFSVATLVNPSPVTFVLGIIGYLFVRQGHTMRKSLVPEDQIPALRSATTRFFHKKRSDVIVLMTLARTDARLSADSKRLVVQYLRQSASFEIDVAVVDELLRRFEPSEAQFREAVKDLARRSSAEKELLGVFAEKVTAGRAGDPICAAKLAILKQSLS